MDMITWFQILDEAVSISLQANTLWDDIYPSVLLPAMGK